VCRSGVSPMNLIGSVPSSRSMSAGSPQVSAQDRIFTRDGLADF
jgi:hypothetical protein